jgi:hypothetical protein
MVCSRKGIVSEGNAQCISGLIVQIFNPALIFSSVLNNSQSRGENFIGIIVLIALCMFAVFILIGHATSGLFSKDEVENRLHTLMTVFSNLGFIGIPLVSALYGSSALIYVAIFILIYNILLYTYGVSLMKGKGSRLVSSENLKSLFNMGTLACCLTLAVFGFNMPVHPMLKTTVSYLGNAATPLALMSIGFSLGRSRILDVFTDRQLYLFSFMKMLVIPAAGAVILKIFNLPAHVLGVSVMMLSMPVGNMPAILASQYGIESDVCSKGVIMTTLLSVVTIPLIASII